MVPVAYQCLKCGSRVYAHEVEYDTDWMPYHYRAPFEGEVESGSGRVKCKPSSMEGGLTSLHPIDMNIPTITRNTTFGE